MGSGGGSRSWEWGCGSGGAGVGLGGGGVDCVHVPEHVAWGINPLRIALANLRSKTGLLVFTHVA